MNNMMQQGHRPMGMGMPMQGQQQMQAQQAMAPQQQQQQSRPAAIMEVRSLPDFITHEQFQHILRTTSGGLASNTRLARDATGALMGMADFMTLNDAQKVRALLHGWTGAGHGRPLQVEVRDQQAPAAGIKRAREDAYGQQAYDTEHYNKDMQQQSRGYPVQQQQQQQAQGGNNIQQSLIPSGAAAGHQGQVAGQPAAAAAAPGAQAAAGSGGLSAMLSSLNPTQLSNLAGLLGQAMNTTGGPAQPAGVQGQQQQPQQYPGMAQQQVAQAPALAPGLAAALGAPQQGVAQPGGPAGLTGLHAQQQAVQQPAAYVAVPGQPGQYTQAPAGAVPGQQAYLQPQQQVQQQPQFTVTLAPQQAAQLLGGQQPGQAGPVTLVLAGGPPAVAGGPVGAPAMGGPPGEHEREMQLPPNASATLFIDHMPLDISKREMAHIFRPIQGYVDLRIVHKENPHRPGDKSVKVFVDFVDSHASTAAMNLLQGYKLDLDDDKSPALRPVYGKPHPAKQREMERAREMDRSRDMDRRGHDQGYGRGAPEPRYDPGMQQAVPPHMAADQYRPDMRSGPPGFNMGGAPPAAAGVRDDYYSRGGGSAPGGQRGAPAPGPHGPMVPRPDLAAGPGGQGGGYGRHDYDSRRGPERGGDRGAGGDYRGGSGSGGDYRRGGGGQGGDRGDRDRDRGRDDRNTRSRWS